MKSICIIQNVEMGEIKGCITLVEKNTGKKYYYRKITNVSHEFVMDSNLDYGSHSFMQRYCESKFEELNKEHLFYDLATPLKNLTEWVEAYIDEIKAIKRVNKTKARLQKYAEQILSKLKDEDQKLLILVE